MVRRWAGAVLAVAGVLFAGCGGPGSDPDSDQVTVRVAAAADLQYAFGEVIHGFTADRPGVRVEVSYGSSGALYQQLASGAPFDLYLSADVSYAERLVGEGVADPDDLFRYAEGVLALWAGEGSPVDPAEGLEAVTQAERVAIANPSHAPYGQAAAAALRSAGVYDEVADRLVLGDSVSQAAEFVAAGNADVGLIALAQVRAPALAGVGTHQEVPTDLHPPLDQGGVVVAAAADPASARALRDYLLSPAGAEILQRYGFGPPVA